MTMEGKNGQIAAEDAIDQRRENDARMAAVVNSSPPDRFIALREGIARDGYAAVQSLTK